MKVQITKAVTNPTGLGRLKEFAFLDGEKLVFGLVSMLTVLFLYKSFTLPRLAKEYQAAALQESIRQTKIDISNYQWDDAVAAGNVKQYHSVALVSDLEVKCELYQPKRGFSLNSLVIAPITARTDPPILNASDVYATGGTGLFAFVDEEVRKKRQVESAVREEERIQRERERQQTSERAGSAGRKRPEGVGSDTFAQAYDPDHPKRRPVGEASLRIPGVALQGDERIERANWACVVALVPVREQLNLYLDSFERARGYDVNHDFPKYLGFLVERAEVGLGKELAWQHVPLYDGQHKSIADNATLSIGPRHGIGTAVVDKLYAAAAQLWAGGTTADAVDERFADRALTLPLPPLVGRDWGQNATHPKLQLNLAELEATRDSAETPIIDEQPSSFASGFGNPGGGLQIQPGIRFAGNIAGRYSRGPGSQSYSGGSGQRPTYYPRGAASNALDTSSMLPMGVDYYLLRFFDFAVEPGKRYKYRVKLAIADPNCGMPTNTLSPEVLDRQAEAAKSNRGRKPIFRLTDDWSAPSPIVAIPIGGSIRLAGVKLPSPEKFNDEPSASLLIEAFAIDEKGNAIKAATEEQNFRRGSVVNLIKDTEYLGPGYIDYREDFRFFTGMTFLDVDGGEKLTRDFSAPSRILLMGPAGQLYIRNEVDDEPFVEQHRLLFEKTNSKSPGPGGRMARRPG